MYRYRYIDMHRYIYIDIDIGISIYNAIFLHLYLHPKMLSSASGDPKRPDRLQSRQRCRQPCPGSRCQLGRTTSQRGDRG